MSRQVLNISKDGHLCNLTGQPVLVLSPSPSSRVSWRSDGAFCSSVFALLIFHCTPLKSAWLYPLYYFPSGVFIHWQDFLWAFSSPDWKAPSLSTFLSREILQSLNHLPSPSLELSGSFISLLCWGAQTELITPAMASPALSRREEAPPSTSPGLLCHLTPS